MDGNRDMITDSGGAGASSTPGDGTRADDARTDAAGKEKKLTRKDYLGMAGYLSDTYANLLAEKKNIEGWLNGNQVFTTDMAIEELLSLTAPTDREPVQTSSISDQTGSIAGRLASGYVERRQRQLQREAETASRKLSYIGWKIGVIEDAMRIRMTKNDAAFYRLMFLRRMTYREIREAHRGRKIYDHEIKKRKDAVVGQVADQVMLCFCDGGQQPFVRMLAAEAARE